LIQRCRRRAVWGRIAGFNRGRNFSNCTSIIDGFFAAIRDPPPRLSFAEIPLAEKIIEGKHRTLAALTRVQERRFHNFAYSLTRGFKILFRGLDPRLKSSRVDLEIIPGPKQQSALFFIRRLG